MSLNLTTKYQELVRDRYGLDLLRVTVITDTEAPFLVPLSCEVAVKDPLAPEGSRLYCFPLFDGGAGGDEVREFQSGLKSALTRAQTDILRGLYESAAARGKDARSAEPEKTAAEAHDKRYRIIAVDFDGCICSNAWPRVGVPIMSTICRLREEKAAGSKLILWTCRRDQMLTDAVEACRTWGVPEFDAVNENIPETVITYGGRDSRKITATEYWDDRAVRVPAYD